MIEVDSAEKATAIAVDFVKKYKQVVIPTSAHKEADVWIVTLDVGAIIVKIATVHVEAGTGAIKEYDIPP